MVDNWTQANQRYLIAALAPVKYMLERHLVRLQAASTTENEEQEEQETRWQTMQQALTAATKAMPAPANLLRLCETFQLSPFERDVLLLCAGMELEGPFATLCTAIQHHTSQVPDKNASTVYPTFSLALAAWSGEECADTQATRAAGTEIPGFVDLCALPHLRHNFV